MVNTYMQNHYIRDESKSSPDLFCQAYPFFILFSAFLSTDNTRAPHGDSLGHTNLFLILLSQLGSFCIDF